MLRKSHQSQRTMHCMDPFVCSEGQRQLETEDTLAAASAGGQKNWRGRLLRGAGGLLVLLKLF